jgi:hypothetical protein
MARWVEFEATKKIYDDFQNWLRNDGIPFVAIFGETVLVHLHGEIGGLANGWTPESLRAYLVQQGFNESQPIILASCYGGTFDKDAFLRYGFSIIDTMYPLYTFCTESSFIILVSEDDSDYELFCELMYSTEILMSPENKALLAALGSHEKIEAKLKKAFARFMENEAIKALFFKYREIG